MQAKFCLPSRERAKSVSLGQGVHVAYLEDDFVEGWKPRPTVVMLHGIAESAEAFNAWVPTLARRCRVIRPDLRGYGSSSPLNTGEALSIPRYADEVDAFVAALGLTRVHLVGAKLGAQIGLELAQRRPPWLTSMTLAGVLISPGRALGQWIPEWNRLVDEHGVEGWARSTMPGRMGRAMDEPGLEWWTRYMALAPASTVKACFAMLPGLQGLPALERIACPTQVIVAVQPERDAAFNQRPSLDAVRQWQERIPRSTLSELQADSYHIAATHPDACAEMTLNYLLEQQA
jgi:3-oxoadipate enol-lactonase